MCQHPERNKPITLPPHTPSSCAPPSLALARFLHQFPQASRIWLVGPLFQPLPSTNTPHRTRKNSALPDPILSLTQIPAGEPILYIDGGAHFRPQHADIPPSARGFSLGDGDSFDGELDEKLDTEKDYSDLAYALNNIPAHFNTIHLLGFLGGRRDHEWMNFGEVGLFLAGRHKPAHVHLHSPKISEHITGFTAGDWQCQQHGIFSLLSLNPAKLTLSGDCRYSLKTPTPLQPLSSQGLSNIGHGEIQIHCNQPFFLISQNASPV